MLALVLKLTLAPGLVAVATYVTRHVGNRAGGLVSGIPVVAGPVELIYAVEHGIRFARTAAAAAVLGIISLVAFCLAYALVALRSTAPAALVVSSLAFALATVILSGVDPPLAIGVAVTLAGIVAGARSFRSLGSPAPTAGAGSDLLIARLVITAALVLALTAAAGALSAHLAGLLVPLPIITAVMAGFTHARVNADAAIEFLAGLVQALVSFLAFFATLAALLGHASATAAFLLATAAALTCWCALVAAQDRGGLRLLRPHGSTGTT